jgi:hypothetical protein
MPLISQDKSYHDFADQSRVWGIPHFYDVVTNIPFLFVGIYGLFVTKRNDWRCFFIGFILTAFGSSYYHLDPHNETLVWDRLPMTISFMSLLSAMCQDYKQDWVKLYPCLVVGISSVIFWALFDELLFYGVVQFGSILWILALLVHMRSPYFTRVYLVSAFLCYTFAKLFEMQDKNIYHLTFRIVSGHNLKHLSAALGGVFIILHLYEENNRPKQTRKTK